MNCPICLEVIDISKNVFETSCEHSFCKSCLIDWCINEKIQNSKQTCPICRTCIQLDIKVILPEEESPCENINEINSLMLLADCANILLVLAGIIFIIFMCIIAATML